MIFKQMDKVQKFAKTQTRRCVKEGETASLLFDSSPHDAAEYLNKEVTRVFGKNGRLKWMEGREYPAIPKMYQKAFGRICIEAIRQERLHDITEADAIAEGVASVEEYRELWESINGKTKGARWDDNPLVWVITFKYLGDVVPVSL